MPSSSNQSLFMLGVKETLPLVIAAMPFGLVFGAMGQAQGLADSVTLSISIFVFAGASQFIAITMLATGAALPVIVFTVFIVNLRHMLYSVSLIPVVQALPQKWRWPMAFTLTDETFAVVYNKMALSHTNLPFYYLGSSAFMYVNWVLCTWIGITLGSQLPSLTSFGLDIAMVVAFVGIVIPNLKLPSHWLCAITAAVSGLLTYQWPHQTGLLLSSLCAIVVGVIVENRLTLAPNIGIKAGDQHE